VPALNYEREMFYEREIRSVTANTRADGEAFLRFAADHHLRVSTHEYPLAHAQQALKDLKAGRFDGAAVLTSRRLQAIHPRSPVCSICMTRNRCRIGDVLRRRHRARQLRQFV
jgi:hypothetical protein